MTDRFSELIEELEAKLVHRNRKDIEMVERIEEAKEVGNQAMFFLCSLDMSGPIYKFFELTEEKSLVVYKNSPMDQIHQLTIKLWHNVPCGQGISFQEIGMHSGNFLPDGYGVVHRNVNFGSASLDSDFYLGGHILATHGHFEDFKEHTFQTVVKNIKEFNLKDKVEKKNRYNFYRAMESAGGFF